MWLQTQDGSIVDQTGKVIFFSTERFVKDICLGDCCFICGVAPSSEPFNDEHILPNWLLRKYNLHNHTITLPNGEEVKYGGYTIPCCESCNQLMGAKLETPIRNAIASGPDGFNKFLLDGNYPLAVIWMGLIFLKTHLRDGTMRMHLDRRKGAQTIGSLYEWEDLHHLHTVVRCFYSGVWIETEVFGSLLSQPVRREASPDEFDFFDLFVAQTMMLRLGDFSLIAVFNDSGATLQWMEQLLKRFTGPVNELQLREVATEFAFLNMHHKELPEFQSEFDMVKGVAKISAKRPALELARLDYTIKGKLLHLALKRALPTLRPGGGLTPDQIVDLVLDGRFTLLFDDDGAFLSAFTPVPLA
jgi:hypothetical protein